MSLATLIASNNSKHIKKGELEPAAPTLPRIYSMRFCPYAERVLLIAAEKGIDCEVVNIHLQQKPEWYFQKHPQGKVPAFEHNGKVVFDSSIIPEYMDAIFPEKPIIPKDPFERAQQKMIIENLSVIQPAFYALFSASKDASIKDEKVAALSKALSDVENHLAHQYFAGASFGYADLMMFPFFERIVASAGIGMGNGLEGHGKLNKWFETVSQREALRSVMQPLDSTMTYLKAYATGDATAAYDFFG